MSYASLRLLNAVPLKKGFENDKPVVNVVLGLYIAKDAVYAAQEITEYAMEAKLSGAALNKAFYDSWKTAASVTEEQRLADQLMHYFSTYGLESLNVKGNYCWLPSDAVDNVNDIPLNRFRLLVIDALSKEEMQEKCFNLLQSGIALKQETINDIISVLEKDCEYTFTGKEAIANKEAMIVIADKVGVIPQNANDALRYFIYKATGSTLVIKNDAAITEIKNSKYRLPDMTFDMMVDFSKIFNRTKPLWLAFKKSHLGNITVVNQISKLSKTNHVPVNPLDNVLGNLTSIEFFPSTVYSAAEKATLFQLVKAYNAINSYSGSYKEKTPRIYRIRNGRSWLNAEAKPSFIRQTSNRNILRNAITRKLKATDMSFLDKVPEGVVPALPVSEKQFLGDIPLGSYVDINFSSGEQLMVGVYWEGQIDIDLSGINVDGKKYGWNSDWRDDDNTIMYSGDVTRAYPHATEWLYFRKVKIPFMIVSNLYHGDMDQKYKIMIAKTNKKKLESNYLCDPNDVVFEVETSFSSRQVINGLIVPIENGIRFYLMDEQLWNERVSSSFGVDVAFKAISDKYKNRLTMKDL